MRAHTMTDRLATVSAVLITAGALVGVGPSVATASTCVTWSGSQPTSPSSNGDTLSSVAVLTPCSVWAVGGQNTVGDASQTLAEQWNGLTWTVTPSSNPGGSLDENVFSAVAVRSLSDAWAVGHYFNGKANQTLIELLSNGTWEQVTSANPGGPKRDNSLDGVAITSARNAWAVGSYNTGTQIRTLIEQWNGMSWSQVPSPSPSPRENELLAVAATSAKNAWAVGIQVNKGGFAQTLILRWNGSKWKSVSSPNPAGSIGSNSLASVAAVSASDAWAVGGYFNKGHPGQALIEQWNGSTWKRVPTPTLDRPSLNGSLNGVAALSAKDAWAVGSYGTTGQSTLAAHWNGSKWTLVPSPDLGSFNDFLGVAASPPASIWAVGNYHTVGPNLTMAFRCC